MSKNSEHEDDAASYNYPPDIAQTEVIDGSAAIFTMYLETSLKEDMEMVEGWKEDANSILIFSGLFSATVAAALGPSLPAFNISPEDAYQRLANQNSNTTIAAISLRFIPSFTLVNSLWFSSLILSLTCALLAISLQQWARRYLVAVRQRRTPYTQARIREYLAEGIRNSGIALLVDLMRAGQQLSFVLFAAGFVTPMFFNFGPSPWSSFIALMWLTLCAALYLCITIVGISRKNSPYYTPLVSFLQFFQLLLVTPYYGTRRSNGFEGTLKRFTQVVRKETEESAQQDSHGLDRRTLEWTFETLNKDDDFERFFAGIPDFCNSRAVDDPMGHLLKLDGEQKLSQALIGFMHRTTTSHLISESARQQRIKICTKAIDAVPTIVASWSTLRRVFGEWEGLLGSVEFGKAVLRISGGDPRTVFCARCIVAIVIARAQVYDRRWFNLTTQLLTSDVEVWDGFSPACLEHGSSAVLANLIFITRIILRFHSEHSRDKLFDVSSRTLSELSSNVDVQLASSEMQHEFCGLWNGLVHEAQAQPHTSSYMIPMISTDILRHLRKSYVALHESTDASLFTGIDDNTPIFSLPGSSYPLCNVQDHRHTSPQTLHAAMTNSHSSRPHLPAPPGSIPLNAVAGATRDANNASPVEVSSAPTLSRPPIVVRSSIEITPAVQESQDHSNSTFSKPESP